MSPYNLNQAQTLLTRQQRQKNAYDNIVMSALISQNNNKIQDKTQVNSVTTADKNFALKNDNVKNTIIVQSGQQKVYDAIKDVSSRYPTYYDALSDVRKRNSNTMISDNSVIYPYATINNTASTTSTTPNLSDPDKPESTVNKQQSSLPQNTAFDIKTLYERNDDINPYEYNYSNSINGNAIDNNRVVSFSNQGIITGTAGNYSMPRYHLIPSEQLIQKEQYTSVMTPYKFRETQGFHNIITDDTETPSDIVTYRDYRYRYSYCFEQSMLEYKDIKQSAGFISSPIDVSSCSYVELDAEQTLGIEYSVIDGNKEVPILPRNATSIEDEKLFFGLMPRFSVTEPNNIIIKKNGTLTGITTIEDLESFLVTNPSQTSNIIFNSNNNYTISYKPNESSKRYFPKNNTIKLKCVQRVIFDEIPCNITAIKILKFGNKKSWNLASFDSDIDYNPANPLYRRG